MLVRCREDHSQELAPIGENLEAAQTSSYRSNVDLNKAGVAVPIDSPGNLRHESTSNVAADYGRFKKFLMEPSVLIVDDEENLLILLDRILSKEGYQVKTANNAYQALEFIDHEPFRVAILDIKMYPIDGVALLAEIKKRCPDIQVIMITAYPTIDTRNDCMKYGAANYLTKPLEIQELKSVVRNLLAA